MYSTCPFCSRAPGRNEAVEAFPIGRRLAFDAARGRLWVVCRACERWNLTPIEERWEAIEECERSFRDTRLREGGPDRVVARVDVAGAEPVKVLRRDLDALRIVPGDAEHPMALRLTAGARTFVVEGPRAMRVASQRLPQENRFGGTRDDVSGAIRQIEAAGSSTAFLARITSDRAERRRVRTSRLGEARALAPDLVAALSHTGRLAIEMGVHEEQERRALEGELVELERAWQAAEEIAGIADNLLPPPAAESILGRLRRAR
jgi:hypothetical protein